MTDASLEGEGELTPDELGELLDDTQLEYIAYLDAVRSPGYVESLAEAGAAYGLPESFELGQLVQWKPAMRNQLLPDYGAPAIVVQMLEHPAPVDPESEAEVLDLVLGIVDGTGTFRVFAFSARRFTAWTA